MLRPLHDHVRRLNSLHKLYDKAIRISKPYRISKIKSLYENEKVDLAICTFESSNYKDVFPTDDLLENVIRQKEAAIQQKEFEKAAILRDKEKARLNELLKRIGIDESDKFFICKDIIYQKAFIL